MAEQSNSNEIKLAAAQTIYETDALMGQYLSLHFGPMDAAFREFAAETGMSSHRSAMLICLSL